MTRARGPQASGPIRADRVLRSVPAARRAGRGSAAAFLALSLVVAAMALLLGGPVEEPHGGVVVVAGERTRLGGMPLGSAGQAAPTGAVGAPEDQGDPPALAILVRSEVRDPAWAGRTEIALGPAIRWDLRLDEEVPLDVSCAATVCEVSGIAGSGVVRFGGAGAPADPGGLPSSRAIGLRLGGVEAASASGSFKLYLRRVEG